MSHRDVNGKYKIMKNLGTSLTLMPPWLSLTNLIFTFPIVYHWVPPVLTELSSLPAYFFFAYLVLPT